MAQRPVLLAMLVLMTGGRTAPADPLVGRPAPPWSVEHWFNSEPLELRDLRGKVVLVRWWTGPGCPYCTSTAPALNEFYDEFGEAGLVVIGFYHHKSRVSLDPANVENLARELGFAFPVAIDPKWKSLKTWWLDTGERDFTSVSFLIDRQGVIRYIHPGGQYVKGDEDYATMRSKIERLLQEE